MPISILQIVFTFCSTLQIFTSAKLINMKMTKLNRVVLKYSRLNQQNPVKGCPNLATSTHLQMLPNMNRNVQNVGSLTPQALSEICIGQQASTGQNPFRGQRETSITAATWFPYIQTYLNSLTLIMRGISRGLKMIITFKGSEERLYYRCYLVSLSLKFKNLAKILSNATEGHYSCYLGLVSLSSNLPKFPTKI